MPARYETIAQFALANGWRFGAELGVLDGRTLLYLLAHCPRLHMYGIDVWDPQFAEPGYKSGERCDCRYCNETRKSRRSRSVQEHEYFVRASVAATGRASIFKMPTTLAAVAIEDGTLDFAFIDANHSYEGVLEDIRIWTPKIKKRGWLFGHDYNMESVGQAVAESFNPIFVHRGDDHLWWIKSPSSVLSGAANTLGAT